MTRRPGHENADAGTSLTGRMALGRPEKPRRAVHVPKWALVALLAGLMLITAADVAWGGTGQVYILPVPGTKIRSGLRLKIDMRWVMGNGYRPIRVRVSPIMGGPAVADRDIEVRLRPASWYGQGSSSYVTGTVSLAQGAAYGEAVFDVPQTNAWMTLDIEAFEDGRELSDLSQDQMSGVIRFYHEAEDATPSILIVHRFAPDWTNNPRLPVYTGLANGTVQVRPEVVRSRDGLVLFPLMLPGIESLNATSSPNGNSPGMAGGKELFRGKSVRPARVPGQELRLLPDIRALASRFPHSYANGYITADRFDTKDMTDDAKTMGLANDLSYMDILPARALPDRWLSFSGIDVIILSLDELESLAREYPEKWRSLREWLSTGPLLCVYGAGPKFDRLARLDALLDAEPIVPEKGMEALRGWSQPSARYYHEEITVLESANRSVQYYRQPGTRVTTTVDSSREKADRGSIKPPDEPPFVFRRCEWGYVVAIESSDPFRDDVKLWAWIFNSVPARNWMWCQRQGLSNYRMNASFWNFLIPEIGRAPVMSFLVLISLFAIVIGPLNYYYLSQRRRLYLLLVTVPGGAFLVTGGLFLYATTSDGLGVRARIRSCTELDQRRGKAVSTSRQTYYAGFAPSRGLVFPATAAVYPIEYEPSDHLSVTRKQLVWGDEQYLTRGYIVSRTTSQMVVIEPQATDLGIRVTESDGDRPPQVTNQLGIPVHRLILCDTAGRLFTATDLASQAKTELRPADMSIEGPAWRGIYGAARPQFPENFDPTKLENVSSIFGGSYRSYSHVPLPTFETSIVEARIRETMTTDFQWMQPRKYVAVVDRPPLVALGVRGSEETHGFHLIVGSW